jgi:hypothetical protein
MACLARLRLGDGVEGGIGVDGNAGDVDVVSDVDVGGGRKEGVDIGKHKLWME